MAPRRSAPRAAWGSITREIVIDKATEVVETEGFAKLSIRALAAALEVSPMALYRHVESKEDLLDEVVNRLLADRWRPEVAERDWQAWITDAADRLRRFLVEQPAALHVYLRRPVVSATALERMSATLGVLHRGVDDDEHARSAYAALQTYTLGFAALEASREASPLGAAGTDAASPAHELAAFVTPEQFRAGIAYLLRGIADGVPA